MKRLLVRSVFTVLVGGAAMVSPVLDNSALADRGGGRCHHDRCDDVEGPFTSEIVPPPPCTSPVGLCTHGILLEDLEATYDFVADTMMPSTDPAHPGRIEYTGHSVITFNNPGKGKLYGEDTGFLDPDAFGNATFETTVNVVDGTRANRHTVGQIVASGLLSFATGHAEGSYTGELCKDNGHR